MTVAKLKHVAKEFELVHDALPKVFERIARIEEWIRIHPEVHRLEGLAVSAVKEATDKRLEEMNNLRKQIDLERAFNAPRPAREGFVRGLQGLTKEALEDASEA
jgi:hypothetical protein